MVLLKWNMFVVLYDIKKIISLLKEKYKMKRIEKSYKNLKVKKRSEGWHILIHILLSNNLKVCIYFKRQSNNDLKELKKIKYTCKHKENIKHKILNRYRYV